MSDLLLELCEKYGVLNLSVEYADHRWKVSVCNRATDNVDEDTLLQDAEDSFNLLLDFMPGALIVDAYGDCIRGASGFGCSSFLGSGKTIVYYQGEIYADHIEVSRKEFESTIDFYIYVFSKHLNTDLSTAVLKEQGLPTPFTLLKEAIEGEGYRLEGFKHGGLDDEGYAYSALLIKDENNQYDLIEYPQRDALIFSGGGDVLPMADAELTSFTSDLLKLLKLIRKGELKTYIETYKY